MALAIRNTFQGTGPIPLTIGAIHNVIAEAWKPLPPGILDEPLDIDITRRRDGLTRVKYSNDAVEDGDIETYPDLLDEANDDDGRPYGPYNGYFFTFDAPGRTGLPPDTPGAKIFYSDNFEEFARISFGVNASGNTLSGSRMSAKFQWYSFSYVEFVNGAWQRVDNNAFNVITEGQNHNSPIPAP
jgi:hypothetical protein